MNASQLQDTWRGLETALAKNLTKAIGVSNFRTEHLEDVAATAKTLPAVNQCQMYVGSHDDDAIARCKEQGIVYEASAPLRNHLVCQNSPILLGIGSVQC